MERLLREILAKRDPEGYYVIPARREALVALRGLLKEATIVEAGDTIFVRVKSRSAAEKIVVILHRRGLLARL